MSGKRSSNPPERNGFQLVNKYNNTVIYTNINIEVTKLFVITKHFKMPKERNILYVSAPYLMNFNFYYILNNVVQI